MIAQEARWAALACFVLAGWTVFGWTISSGNLSSRGRSRPTAAMSAHDVVVTVVDALQHNDSPLQNSGILAAYRFASPDNRRVTGPYGRFLRLVKTPPNDRLTAPAAVTYGALQQNEEQATQDVMLHPAHADAITYRFALSRQKDGECVGCWMVDGVVPVQ